MLLYFSKCWPDRSLQNNISISLLFLHNPPSDKGCCICAAFPECHVACRESWYGDDDECFLFYCDTCQKQYGGTGVVPLCEVCKNCVLKHQQCPHPDHCHPLSKTRQVPLLYERAARLSREELRAEMLADTAAGLRGAGVL